MGRSSSRDKESSSSKRHRHRDRSPDDEDHDRHASDRKKKRRGHDDEYRRGRTKDNEEAIRGEEEGAEKSHDKKRRRDKERSPSSDSSASVSGSDDDSSLDSRHRSSGKEKRRKKDDKKKKKKKHKKSKDSKKDKKSKKHKKKRKHREDDDDDDNEKGGRKKHKKSKSSRKERVTEEDLEEMQEKARNYALSEALHQLLLEHPTTEMATNTLPLVLIKLGGGTMLDLRHMPDQSAAAGLGRVLTSLETFGVCQQERNVWQWTVPGGGPNTHRDERILVRIVRTLLNDIGFSMEAIERREQEQIQQAKRRQDKQDRIDSKNNKQQEADSKNASSGDKADDEFKVIEGHTQTLLRSFLQQQQKNGNGDDNQQKEFTLPGELGGLCKMILEGESIALGGLPDATLKQALENLFQTCGLELVEMDDDDDSDDNESGGDEEKEKEETPSKSMGYGLPETPEQQRTVMTKLLSVMRACEQAASSPSSLLQKSSSGGAARVPKGPMPMPANYQAPEESSDEDGPAPIGSEALARRKDPGMSKEMLKRQAEMRARQLRGAVTGQEELMSTDPDQREEWMLVPGKFDFLSSIKSGNPMKSRNFNAKSKAGEESEGRVMDPAIKAEMDAIMQAHSEARGPTLVEQHRLKKEQDRQEAAAGGGKKGKWNWNRNNDLDAGRRVDTNALNMVLGGAVTDLKKKFQGGF